MNRVGVFRRDPEFPEEPEGLVHKPFEALSNMENWPRSKKRIKPTIIMRPKIAMTNAAAEAVVKELLGDV